MILHLLLSQFTKYIAIGNNYTFFRGLTPCGTNLISFENIHLIWVRHSHSVYGTFFKLEISNSFYIILYKLGRVTWNHLVLRRDGATLLRYFFFSSFFLWRRRRGGWRFLLNCHLSTLLRTQRAGGNSRDFHSAHCTQSWTSSKERAFLFTERKAKGSPLF